MIVAIHQPNFFPWLGYFDKIAKADVFVFLDGVSFPKNSWVNRVRIAVQGAPHWLTCPIRHAPLGTPIHDIEIDDTQGWRKKMVKTLQANYGRAPHFEETMTMVQACLDADEKYLAAFNQAAIERIAMQLGLKTRFVRQSALDAEGESNALLISIIKACGGDTYLIGGGADGYHDDALFEGAGIGVRKQNYAMPVYGAANRFLPGLSVLDYLMMDGRPFTAAQSA